MQEENSKILFCLLNLFLLFGCASDTSKGQATASGATATFSSIQTNILNKSCTGCHGGSSPLAGLDLSTHTKVIQSSRIVNTSSPASSKLYTRVKNETPLMPIGGGTLADADSQAILDWITAGAPNN